MLKHKFFFFPRGERTSCIPTPAVRNKGVLAPDFIICSAVNLTQIPTKVLGEIQVELGDAAWARLTPFSFNTEQ